MWFMTVYYSSLLYYQRCNCQLDPSQMQNDIGLIASFGNIYGRTVLVWLAISFCRKKMKWDNFIFRIKLILTKFEDMSYSWTKVIVIVILSISQNVKTHNNVTLWGVCRFPPIIYRKWEFQRIWKFLIFWNMFILTLTFLLFSNEWME